MPGNAPGRNERMIANKKKGKRKMSQAEYAKMDKKKGKKKSDGMSYS